MARNALARAISNSLALSIFNSGDFSRLRGREPRDLDVVGDLNRPERGERENNGVGRRGKKERSGEGKVGGEEERRNERKTGRMMEEFFSIIGCVNEWVGSRLRQ